MAQTWLAGALYRRGRLELKISFFRPHSGAFESVSENNSYFRKEDPLRY